MSATITKFRPEHTGAITTDSSRETWPAPASATNACPLRVTRFGKRVADIVAPRPDPPRAGWLGGIRDTAEIVGDWTVPSSELVR